MDKTKKYMLMCRSAEHYLRGTYELEEGDYIFRKYEEIKILSSKVVRVDWKHSTYALAVPKSMTLVKPILESQPMQAMERGIDTIDFEFFPKEHWVRLHKQDQLQEMIGNFEENKRIIDSVLFGMKRNDYTKQFRTWEQLLLAIVMERKFNRKWQYGIWDRK